MSQTKHKRKCRNCGQIFESLNFGFCNDCFKELKRKQTKNESKTKDN